MQSNFYLSELSFQLNCFYAEFFNKQIEESGKFVYNYYINDDEIPFLNTDWLKEYLTSSKVENNILFREIALKSKKIVELWNNITNDDIDENQKLLYLCVKSKRLYITKSFEPFTHQFYSVKSIADKCALIVNIITAFFPNILDDNNNSESQEPEILDYSDTMATEKIIFLHKSGILEYLRKKPLFMASTNKLAEFLSAVTGEEAKTLQSYLNPIISRETVQKNNPLNKAGTVKKAEQKLINIGFNTEDFTT